MLEHTQAVTEWVVNSNKADEMDPTRLSEMLSE